MSRENAVALLEAISKDEELYNKYKAADAQGRVKMAEAMGLPYTEEELKAVVEEAESRDEKLSDEELEKVSGGCLAAMIGGMLAKKYIHKLRNEGVI